jgi:hypothetical protein
MLNKIIRYFLENKLVVYSIFVTVIGNNVPEI